MSHIVSRTGIGKVPPASPLFLDVAGPVNFDSHLTVLGNGSFNGLLSVQRATNIASFELRVPSDANPTFQIRRDGLMEWGPGGASAVDVSLYRVAVASLRTSGSFTVDVNLAVSGDALVSGTMQVNGSAILGSDDLTDIVTFNSRIASSLVPATSDISDLGSSTLRWRDLFISRNATFGDSSADTIIFNAYAGSGLFPALNNTYALGLAVNRWADVYVGSVLDNSGNTVLGTNSSNTLAINASVTTSILPSVGNSFDLGSASFKWRSVFVGSDLSVDGNVIVGSSSSDTITFNSQIVNSLIPNSASVYNLGSALLPWNDLFLSGALNIGGTANFTGNVIFGDASTDTVTFNSRVDSDIDPALDNTYDLGAPALRWKTLHVGPGSVVVHNDNTDTSKVTLGFTGSIASLLADAASQIRISVGASNGLLLDTFGNVGVGLTATPAYRLDVSGDIGASDTIRGMRASGASLYAEANVVVKGSVEAETSSGVLNLGSTSDTNLVNIGTSSGVQTVNIGTGPGQTVINIGASGDIININGTAAFSNTINTSVQDKTFTLNAGGANLSASASGLYVEEAAATLLSSTDAMWQSGNIVRYLMANTGNIAAGNLVTITGFVNGSNNGTFAVSAVSVNAYIDVVSARSSAVGDETGASGSVTNPEIVGSFFVNSARTGWELRSPSNYASKFEFINQGANAIFTAVSGGDLELSISGAFIPSMSGADLGSTSRRWDLFAQSANANSLDVSGNSTLGTNNTNTVTLNGVANFVNKISSHLLPSTATQDLGSVIDLWRDLYMSGSADIAGAVDVGTNLSVTLDLTVYGNATIGDTSSDVLSVPASIGSSLVPSINNSFNLGSPSFAWSNLYVSNLTVPSLTAGRVVFAGTGGALSDDDQFLWDSTTNSLAIGPVSPVASLDVSRAASAPSLRLARSDASEGASLFVSSSEARLQYTSSLLFTSVSFANLATANSGTDALRISSSGQMSSLGAFSFNVNGTITSNTYTVSTTDTVVRVDSSSGSITANCTITLPSAATKRILIIKDIGNNCSATNKNILLAPQAGEFVEFGAASASYTMDTDGMSLTLHSDGSNRWYII